MLVFLLILLGLARAQEAGPADILTYPIGAGDVVRLVVVGQADMSGEILVGSDGTLVVPLAGSVHIAGMTIDEARASITQHLAAGFLRTPQVLIEVARYESKRVGVSGGVKNEGTYPIQSADARVSSILLQAGGLLDASAPVAEIRRGGTVIEVDIEAINKGDPVADVVVQAGDHLYVPPVERVFVDGQVQKPGPIPWREGMTVTEALVEAGSMLGTARKSGVYVVRGEQKTFVNLKRVEQGREADFRLEPSDRVVVPESPI